MAFVAMPADSIIQSQLATVLNGSKIDFWIFLIIGVVSLLVGIASLYFSIRAFLEASGAQRAAKAAAAAVKTHSDTIELTQLSQPLDRLELNINFSEARKLLSETSRRAKRVIAGLQNDQALKQAIDAVQAALNEAQEALQSVKPANDVEQEKSTPLAVYYALESPFTTLNDSLAVLCGLLDSKVTT